MNKVWVVYTIDDFEKKLDAIEFASSVPSYTECHAVVPSSQSEPDFGTIPTDIDYRCSDCGTVVDAMCLGCHYGNIVDTPEKPPKPS